MNYTGGKLRFVSVNILMVTNKSPSRPYRDSQIKTFLKRKKSLKYLILLTEYLHIETLIIVNAPSLKSIRQ